MRVKSGSVCGDGTFSHTDSESDVLDLPFMHDITSSCCLSKVHTIVVIIRVLSYSIHVHMK